MTRTLHQQRPRPAGLLPLPLPPGIGLCLVCPWATADDELAAARHTRNTGHPTIFQPREPERDADGDQ